jgi:hypothetical protein
MFARGRLWKSLVVPKPGKSTKFTGTNFEFMVWRDSFLEAIKNVCQPLRTFRSSG